MGKMKSIFNTNWNNSKPFKTSYNTKELGSIRTEENEGAHNDEEGKKHIAWIFNTNWNNSKTF
jgi:hypothetical protein